MRSKAPEMTWTRVTGQGLVVVIATFLLVTGPVEAAGICTTASIEEVYRLPDGTVQPPGTLTLCFERNFSPVASLYEIRVDAMAVGLFMTRRDTNLEIMDNNRPFMMFQRIGVGELLLVGLANPVHDGMLVNYLGRTGRAAKHNDLVASLNDPAFVQVLATTL